MVLFWKYRLYREFTSSNCLEIINSNNSHKYIYPNNKILSVLDFMTDQSFSGEKYNLIRIVFPYKLLNLTH